jgi:hypothetical protein
LLHHPSHWSTHTVRTACMQWLPVGDGRLTWLLACISLLGLKQCICLHGNCVHVRLLVGVTNYDKKTLGRSCHSALLSLFLVLWRLQAVTSHQWCARWITMKQAAAYWLAPWTAASGRFPQTAVRSSSSSSSSRSWCLATPTMCGQWRATQNNQTSLQVCVMATKYTCGIFRRSSCCGLRQ